MMPQNAVLECSNKDQAHVREGHCRDSEREREMWPEAVSVALGE